MFSSEKFVVEWCEMETLIFECIYFMQEEMRSFSFSVISVGSVRDLIAEVRSKPKIFTQNATAKTSKIQRKTEQPPRVTRAIFPQDIQGLARGLLHGGAQG